MISLLHLLTENDYDIKILSDSNTVYIERILKVLTLLLPFLHV